MPGLLFCGKNFSIYTESKYSGLHRIDGGVLENVATLLASLMQSVLRAA